MATCSDGQLHYGTALNGQTSRSQQSGSGQAMESMEKMTEHLVAAAPFVGTALFGCLLQALKTGWQGWRNFVVSCLSAAFGAWIVYCLVGDLFSPGWGQAVSGMVGYSGGKLVDVALSAFTRKVERLDKLTKMTGPNDSMED